MKQTKKKPNILITAGPTREFIDPVRFISNISSGQMGIECAKKASSLGFQTTLILGPSSIQTPKNKNVRIIRVTSAQQMFDAVKKCLPKTNVLIMSAAVADYTPLITHKTKLHKQNKPLSIKLKRTIDILKWAGENKKKNQILVGFALESSSIQQNALKKLKTKQLDLIVGNKPNAANNNSLSCIMIDKLGNIRKYTKITKQNLANEILDFIMLNDKINKL